MESPSWQQELREVIRDRGQLLEHLGLQTATLPAPETATAAFPMKVPGSYLARIRRDQENDPLLRQILPIAEEDTTFPGFTTDPLGEASRQPVPGLIHKYHGRVLLVTTGVCAIHCRYCFRRHYPYSDNNPNRENWTGALEYIRSDPGIREVILSGGDPLSLADEKLGTLIRQLEQIPHLRWLRVHTRMPVVLPSRVTSALIEALTKNRFRQTLVVHVNHPHEIDEHAGRALETLHHAGIQLLNQSVLLRGVNDNADILSGLSVRLYTHHVLPYYLHRLDPVAGAAHFEVDDETAKAILHQLSATLPGYLVPRLVREIEGAPGKSSL